MEDMLVIMVVEDDQSIQGIIEEALGDGGFEPAIAASGEEAVTLLKGSKGKYRALVTDINLKGRMDGWEVARQSREIDRDAFFQGERIAKDQLLMGEGRVQLRHIDRAPLSARALARQPGRRRARQVACPERVRFDPVNGLGPCPFNVVDDDQAIRPGATCHRRFPVAE